ncbi:diguanylate cyclase [Parashewanella spongiae]|uniref:Diguanylate cyclase n=1 Tax=Parashewanella spongiae TaxID=342950 RepID=A0A3A6TJH9_9GAMM|nr:diguanylate cyclase [Parashewanella spongiae]MCL1079373.1 diguanylate cyclase [Parashewanella spongiae]RJY07516.1 diguanylate cyclase [Parashewanella spongiae]
MDTSDLLINAILYVFLPLWGAAGFVDWCCHRATKIETTSGIKESLLHSLMGIQIAIPIALCLAFYVNVLILLLCIITWISHEIVAHWDVKYAAPKREISIWEMHAHTYLGSLPLYMLISIIVINWQAFLQLIYLDWAGNLSLVPMEEPHGSSAYLPAYVTFMMIACVFPYAEENLRCLKAYLIKGK